MSTDYDEALEHLPDDWIQHDVPQCDAQVQTIGEQVRHEQGTSMDDESEEKHVHVELDEVADQNEDDAEEACAFRSAKLAVQCNALLEQFIEV